MASQSDDCAKYPGSGSSGVSTANESELTQAYPQPDPQSDAEFKRLVVKIAKQLGDRDRETISYIHRDELGPDGSSMTGLNMLDKLEKAGVFHAGNIAPLVKLLRDDCGRHDIVNKHLEPYRKNHADHDQVQQDPATTVSDHETAEMPRKKPRLGNSTDEFDVSDIDRECDNASVHGIIVDVTSIRSTKRYSARKYFKAEVTDGKETLTLVCFIPPMRSRIEKCKKSRKPCTIKNCSTKISTYPPTMGDFELHCTAKTKAVANPTKKFNIPDDFICTPTRVLDQLSELDEIIKGQSVTVCGKISDITGPNEVQSSSGSKLQKQECILADNSMSIKLTIWEELIGQIHKGKSYRFINVKMRHYQGKRFLTTTEDSKFDKVDDIGEVTTEKTLPSTHTEICGRIAAVDKVVQYKACPSQNCNAKVDRESQECSKCHRSVNLSLCKDQVYAKFTVQDESKVSHDVTAFTEVLSQITGSQTLLSLSESQIKRLLHGSKLAVFVVDMEKNIVIRVTAKR